LRPTDTLEATPDTEAAEATHQHDHLHEHDGHDHGSGSVHRPADAEPSTGIQTFNPECTRELVLDIPVEEVSKAYGTVTGNFRKYAKIPGFRAGKVPDSVIKRRYASEIRKEVVDGLLPQRFNRAVLDLGVKPVGQPQVIELTVEDGLPLHVKAVFEYLPEFSIDGYQSVIVEKPSVELAEEEFQRELAQLRESRATIEPVEEDRALVDGDWAEIGYSGLVEGEAEAAPLDGENELVEIGGKGTIEAFTAVLRGARPGQELKAEVVYPANYAEPKLASKTVAYTVQVKAIKKRILPELDDDFAKELGNYENLAQLESGIRQYAGNRKRRSVEGETKDRLLAALCARFAFPVPEALVQEQIDARLDRGLRALAAQGMETEQMRKLDFARLRAAQRDGAVAEAKASLLLDRIAQEENVTVEESEVDRQVTLIALQSGEQAEALRERLTQNGGLSRIREQMRREKVANLLYERLPA